MTEPAMPATSSALRERDGVRRTLVLAVLAALLLSLSGVFDHTLWTPDSPRVAEIGREMYATGDLVVPKLSGQPFFEKPPAYWWVMTGVFHVFGVSDGTARLTSAIALFLMLLMVYDATRRIAGGLAGLLAVIAAGTMSGVYQHYHRVLVDPWLGAFVMFGYWGFVLAAFPSGEGAGSSAKKAVGIVCVYLGAGLAFLAKGLVGPGLVVSPVILYVLLTRRWDLFRSKAHLLGLPLLLALVGLWPFLLYERGGKEMFDHFVIHNELDRFLPSASHGAHVAHVNPFWYYLEAFPGETLPWLLAVPAVFIWLRRRREPAHMSRAGLLFLALVFPFGLFLLSFAGTKRGLYLLPLIPPLGALVGAWLAGTVEGPGLAKSARITFWILLALFAVLPVVGVGGLLVVQGVFGAPPKVYRLAYPPPLSPGLLISLAAWVGLAFWLLVLARRRLKEASAETGLAVATLVLVSFVFGGAFFYRVLEPVKNLHRMTDGLVAAGVATPSLVGYHVDEVTRGIVPFETGLEKLKTTDDPKQLVDWANESRGLDVLILSRNRSLLPDELRPRIHVVVRWRYGRHRSYQLLRIDPVRGGSGGR